MQNDPRAVLVEICHLMAERNFTTSSGGNVSVKMSDGTYWLTPSMLNKARVQVEDLVRVDEECCVVEGVRKPSSEMQLHLLVYKALPQAGAVVHAHPPAATAFAQAGRAMDTRSSSEGYVILGPEVPLIPYARPTTAELATVVQAALRPRHQAYLLANHGVITWSDTLWGAYDVLDTLELFAQTLIATEALGGPVLIPDDELAWLESKAVIIS